MFVRIYYLSELCHVSIETILILFGMSTGKQKRIYKATGAIEG